MKLGGWAFTRGVAAGAVLGAVLTFGATLRAQVTTIDFVVPTGTAISTGGTGDFVVFIGKSASADGVTVGDCGTGEFPSQNAVAVDPGGGRATRILGIINTSSASSVAPGTRLKNLIAQGSCSGGQLDKYRGEVQ